MFWGKLTGRYNEPMPKLLLLDDSAEIGLIVQNLGRRSGWEVVHRPDVESAWEALRTTAPDLLLLDINLPGGDGLDLCRRLRSAPAHADFPVALFCHLGLAEAIARGLEAGADYLVAKELVSQPAAWQKRLADIWAQGGGRPAPMLVGLPGERDLPPVPDGWMTSLQRALRHPSIKEVGPEILRVFLHQALAQAFTPATPGAAPHPGLFPEGTSLDPDGFPRPCPPRAVFQTLVVLSERMRCLLGTEASAPFRATLAGVVPGFSELLPRS